MARRGAASQANQDGGEIDLTPMLDVVFIMLIFFIVTAVFIKEPGVQVARPETQIRDQVKNQNVLRPCLFVGEFFSIFPSHLPGCVCVRCYKFGLLRHSLPAFPTQTWT